MTHHEVQDDQTESFSLRLRRLQPPVLGQRMDLHVHIHGAANERVYQTLPWKMETLQVLLWVRTSVLCRSCPFQFSYPVDIPEILLQRNPETIVIAGSFVNSRAGAFKDSYKENILCFGKQFCFTSQIKCVFQLEETMSRVLGQRVTNSQEQTKLTYILRIQQLELSTRMWSGRAPWNCRKYVC